MTFKSNIAELKIYKSVAPDGNKLKIENVIDLYQKKKIPNYKSALNAVVALSSKHKATIASKKPEKLYESLIEKYETAESMTGRLSRPPAFSVRTGNHSKVNSYIQFEFNYKPDDEDIEKRTLKQMILSLGNRPYSQLEKAFVGKSSMKVRLRLYVWLERERRNDEGEIVKEVKKGEKPFITKPPQRMTKSTIKRVLNEQVGRMDADLDGLGEKMEGSGWVVKRYLKLAIDMFEIKVARGSSYIPTPARYAHAKSVSSTSRTRTRNASNGA